MIVAFMKNMLSQQRFILNLAKKDFKTKYMGSYLGTFWAFLLPVVQILIFWFVFQVGFKSMPVDNFPFILWLSSAMIPWFFISDCIQNSTNSIVDNSYLVKKVVFRVGVLPLIKIYSAIFVHLFFIFFIFIMFLIYGYMPSIYNLQVLYYMFGIIVLVLGISWITSALVVFFKDTGQIVAMFLQIGFWLTPIFYSLNIVPEKFRVFLKLNPAFYLIEGYRDTFVYHKWFWEHPYLTIYFWTVSLLLMVIGIFVFKRLRPHFADVL
ncbi:ABC transporter permease [Paenibacillus contaminans]|uniref:Transport permease protein n=1 Tax=Paenibacillus contaminans TaxID=450362 RepID=A0A329M0R9_9BACL|nr:ABC transporter permease [Paenibacillus contaminans]RAV13795.1 ABC transporter permease [Paenibacillus contaminans]